MGGTVSEIADHTRRGVVVFVQHFLKNFGETLRLVPTLCLCQSLNVRGFDLSKALWPLQLDQAFALGPGVALDLAGGRVGFFLLVSLRLLVQIRVTLF